MTEYRRMPCPGDGRGGFCQPDGVVAALSDALEDDPVESAAVVLGPVRSVPAGPRLTADESWFMLRRTAERLADAVNVAELRGERLEAAKR